MGFGYWLPIVGLSFSELRWKLAVVRSILPERARLGS